MQKYLKISLIIIGGLILMFSFIFIAGNKILPNLFGENLEIDSLENISTGLLNKKAPYFDLLDTNGERVRLNNFLNIPVVVVFWASWNTDSTDQIRILDDYLSLKSMQSSLIKIITINSMDESSVVKSFVRRGGYNVHFALDITGDISNMYNIKSLPTTYFIDRDGVVRDVYTGILSSDMLIDKVDQILR